MKIHRRPLYVIGFLLGLAIIVLAARGATQRLAENSKLNNYPSKSYAGVPITGPKTLPIPPITT